MSICKHSFSSCRSLPTTTHQACFCTNSNCEFLEAIFLFLLAFSIFMSLKNPLWSGFHLCCASWLLPSLFMHFLLLNKQTSVIAQLPDHLTCIQQSRPLSYPCLSRLCTLMVSPLPSLLPLFTNTPLHFDTPKDISTTSPPGFILCLLAPIWPSLCQ